MIRKLIVISISVLFTLVIFFPSLSASNKSTDDSQNKSIFGLATYIEVSLDIKPNITLPIIPFSEMRTVNFTIKYRIISSPRPISNLIFRLLYLGRRVDIKLEIVDSPKWCVVTLLPGKLSTALSLEERELSSFLTISVTKDAPALKEGIIKINVSTDDIKGIFGLNVVNGNYKQFDIPVRPAYVPIMNVEFPWRNRIEISPYNETKIPIKIKNLGNGKTRVIAEIENASKNWEVSISNVTIDVGETNQIFLVIKADHRFNEESLRLKLTPAFADNLLLTGKSENFKLSFINDGSYQKGFSFKIDSIIFSFIIVLIIIMLIATIIIKRRKK